MFGAHEVKPNGAQLFPKGSFNIDEKNANWGQGKKKQKL